jgi:hypothetical protein
MSEESSLIVIAEIAAALAGFSGIAATFGRRSDRAWSQSERRGLADLLNHSGIALFAALVPLVFAQREGFTPSLWRNSSSFWAIFALIGIALQIRWVVSQNSREVVRKSALTLIGFVSLLVFQVYNALNWQLAWPYLLALVGNLGFAFIQFMKLVNPANEDGAA